MSLRLKLFLPLALIAGLLAFYITQIWTPQLIEHVMNHRRGEQAHLETLTQLPLWLLTAMALGLAMVFWLVETLVRRPLRHLAAASAGLANNQFDVPLPAASRDEMGALVRDFAAMRRTVKQHREALAVVAIELETQKHALDEHNVVVTCDAAGRIVSANNKFYTLSGYAQSESVGAEFCALIHNGDAESLVPALRAALRASAVWQGELTLRKQAGGGLCLNATAMPYVDAHGFLLRFIVVATDVSARRLIEQRLVATEARMRHLITSSHSVIYTTVPSGDARITYVSDNLGQLLGYQPREVFANPDFWHDHIHPEDRPKVFSELPRLFISGQHAHEYRFLHGDGSYRWIFDQVRLIRGVDDQPLEVVGSLTDITQQKLAEQAAQEREERLRTIFDNALDAIFTIDTVGRIETANPAALRMFGYAVDELIGAPVKVLMPSATAATHDDRLRGYLANGPRFSHFQTREVTAQRKDGSEFPAEIAISHMSLKDGDRFLGVIRNITERKQAEQVIIVYRDHLEQLVKDRTRELEHARDDALVAEKAMSTFLANMSHELRTPLHGILSFATFGIKKINKASPEKLQEYFGEIRDSGQRLLELVNNLLDLSKLRAGKMTFEFQSTELRGIVRDVIKELQAYCDERKVLVRWVGEPDDTRLIGDRVKLTQVVRNLLSNAIKFSPTGNGVELALEADASNVKLMICDRGVGIPDDELELIFDPFTQSSNTATNAGGTGLGLPICREIIEQGHGGQICAQNRDGGGACFTVLVPRKPTTEQAINAASS